MSESAFLAFARRAERVVFVVLVIAFLMAPLAVGQQYYVGRYDAFGGYTFINAPYINLNENGFHTQVGLRLTNWLSGGFDYSVAKGSNVLLPNMLVSSVQQQLGGQLAQLAAAGLLPSGYRMELPVDTKTQSFTMGPQLAYRHFSAVTFFVRPNLGALQVTSTPRPADAIQTAVVKQLAPTGKKTDWTYYWGFGGGIEYNVTQHVALRFQADLVHNYMFNDLLPGTNVVRFSVGPGFQWGRNVVKR